jgi:phospholipid/cholesterol/gamma-HCH transport system substrate-binding protein
MPRPKRQPYALYGVAMLAVIGMLATLSIMAFKQEFTSVTPVTMKIQRAGLQLLKGSDVKMRGLIVGDVKNIDSTGDGATISLNLNPSMIKNIPSNVNAQLIPKTVFGEKYINLVMPANPSPRHIASGDVIAQDSSTPALEIDQALNDLLPLLRTVRPQDLNSTLSAVANALSGRGEKLGQTTVKLQNYLGQINPHLPQIQHDFQALAKVATTYDQAAPALLALLRNFTVTSNTITDKSAVFTSLLKDLTGTALVTRDFVARNAQNIVAVNVVNKDFIGLLAQYSPEFDCLFKGAANLLPKVKGTKDTKHTAGVLVEFHGPKPAYVYPLDSPEYNDYRGPACYGLPNPPLVLPTVQFKDGTEDDPRFADRNGHTDAQPLNLTFNNPDGGSVTSPLGPLAPVAGALNPLTSTLLGPSSVATASPSMGDAGSAGDLAAMNQILGPILGRPADKVPAIAGLLWGPMARGSEVNVG